MELTTGQVAVVTGGGSGIGLALAERLGAAGCTSCSPTSRRTRSAAAAEAVEAHGVDVLTVRTDVSKEADVQALAAATLERFGAVHVVCNNAGVAAAGRPVVRAAELVGVGDGRQLLGRRPRLPDVPPPPRRRRPHRQHGLDRRALPGFGPSLRRVQARRRGDHREPLQHGHDRRAADRRQRAVPRLGAHAASSTPTATGRPRSGEKPDDDPATTSPSRTSSGRSTRAARRRPSPTPSPTRSPPGASGSSRTRTSSTSASSAGRRSPSALDPAPAEHVPGMPPRSQIVAEVAGRARPPPRPHDPLTATGTARDHGRRQVLRDLPYEPRSDLFEEVRTT